MSEQLELFGMPAPATPFLKWAGGKQALLKELLPRFPERFERWVEPFLGGGSVFFARAPERALLADRNAWLIATYAAVRDSTALVAAELDRMPRTREAYLRFREQDPWSLDPARRAALFVYLNKTGFRGLFRVNREGRFNVPWGAYDRRLYDLRDLEAASLLLRRAELLTADFEVVLAAARPGDFVYLDPPYLPTSSTSDFDRYTEFKFRLGDHERLATSCRGLAARGIPFALSNSDTPEIRSLFAGFRFHSIPARREINLDSSRRSIGELLVTDFD